MKYVHEKKFFARYSDVDFKDELKASSLLSYFQEVACTSADELGFGYEYLKPKKMGFITANTYVKLLKPVGIEAFTVKTWPTPPKHIIFDRQYSMYNSSGEKSAVACSRWCLVDLNTFKMLPASVLKEQDYSSYNTDKEAEVLSWKVEAFDERTAEKKFVFTVANSEYDHYMHVNNTRYADYIFNCFSVNELNEKSVDSFQINYIKQAHEGDVLSFYRIKKNENNYRVFAFNQGGENIISGKISFK